MKDQGDSIEYGSRDSSRWLWLSGFTSMAVISLSSGKLLVAAGMVLLGVFAFFNNPLRPTTSHLARPAPAMALSWACGAAGITLIIAAAARAWL